MRGTWGLIGAISGALILVEDRIRRGPRGNAVHWEDRRA